MELSNQMKFFFCKDFVGNFILVPKIVMINEIFSIQLLNSTKEDLMHKLFDYVLPFGVGKKRRKYRKIENVDMKIDEIIPLQRVICAQLCPPGERVFLQLYVVVFF
jgi:hypothetical protein